MSTLFIITGSLTGLFLLGFGLVSVRERENRAAAVAITCGLVFLAAWFGLGLRYPQWSIPAAVGLMAAAALAALLMLYPMGENTIPEVDAQKARRLDEREIMFARARLKQGTPQFEEFYQRLRPDLAEVDGELRQLPRLGEPGGRFYTEKDGAYFEALFDYIEEINHLGDITTPRRAEPLEIAAAEATRRIKAFARHLGALEVGITPLKEHHLYSHVGRGQGAWGEPVTLHHRFVIVFTVEMDPELIRNAPMMPAIAESATQYLRGTMIAATLAGYCSRLGYPARAHVDGNYRVLATTASRHLSSSGAAPEATAGTSTGAPGTTAA
ncbi:MAG: hypothetical protein WCA82_16680 [Jiangellales bacterium]